MNATVTVTYGDKSETFELSGNELSEVARAEGKPPHRYLTNASRGFIADEVEQILRKIAV